MKIHLEYNGTVIEYEHRPLPGARFRALCSLAMYAIAGAVFLGAIALVGVWAIAGAAGMLVAYGFYKIIRSV